jgi:hypothetical protein
MKNRRDAPYTGFNARTHLSFLRVLEPKVRRGFLSSVRAVRVVMYLCFV